MTRLIPYANPAAIVRSLTQYLEARAAMKRAANRYSGPVQHHHHYPHVDTRQLRKRAAFKESFTEITAKFGGESRRARRAMAWSKARRLTST